MLSSNTCIMLIDLWNLSPEQKTDLGDVFMAWLYSDEKIGKLIQFANKKEIAIFFRNRGRPVSAHFTFLLSKSNLVENFKDYENLVYAGYALDACVAERKGYGYTRTASHHKKYLIKDAGLVQHILYHGKSYTRKVWPEYAKIMKATSPDRRLPWKTAQDIMRESIFFCDNFASEFCTPLLLREFKELVNETLLC